MEPEEALIRTLDLLSMILPVMFASLIATNFLFSRFRKTIGGGFAVTSFLIHPVVGVSALSAMYKSGDLGLKGVARYVAISTLPRGLRAAILFLAPIAVSTLGIRIGLYFVSLDIVSRLIFSAMLVLPGIKGVSSEADVKAETNDYEFDFIDIFRVFARTTAILAASVYLTFLIFQFDAGKNADLIILFSGAMSTTAGISAAGTLINAGVLEWKRALMDVYVSRILHVFVEATRLSLPLFTSFFGFRDGLKLLIVHIVSNSLVIALAALLLSVL
ncbi:hypothetical protein [Archaeoglobus neptunius]|uniref:hypothetical protein n=1 Tax=Archaeoglobus neptunius TaxID=2798580 RepID=UPI0019279A0C|nr:hypothetical protein [Archaeoglobus neptunius]